MKKNIILTVLTCFLSGCSFFDSAEPGTEPNLLTIIQENHWETISSKYTLRPWIRGGCPVPQDRLMLAVKRKSYETGAGEKIRFHIPRQDSLISEFNANAAEKILSGEAYSPEMERKNFILKHCGQEAMPYITEYFRRLERKHFSAFSTSGVTNGAVPKVNDIYESEDLNILQKLLEKARDAGKGSAYEKRLQKEVDFFLECRKSIETQLDEIFPQVHPGKGETHILQALRGGTAKRTTTAQCSYSSDGKFLIFRFYTEEPEMNQRLITGTERDYKFAWKDDRYEIFIVTDPSQLFRYHQFIITSAGVLLDGRRFRDGYPCDLKWNSSAELNVIRLDDCWKAELKIPLSDLEIEGKIPESAGRINIYRFREIRGSKTEGSALAPILSGSNFQPKRFGKIVWKERDAK